MHGVNACALGLQVIDLQNGEYNERMAVVEFVTDRFHRGS